MTKFYAGPHQFILDIEKNVKVPSGLRTTPEKLSEFQSLVIRKNFDGGELTTSDVIDHISRVGSEVSYFSHFSRGQMEGFTSETIKYIGKLRIREYPHEALIQRYTKPVAPGINSNPLPGEKHPAFNEGIESLCNSVDLATDNVEHLRLILKCTQVSETLTFLASNPLLLKTFGVGLYLSLSCSLNVSGSFTKFMEAVVDMAREKTSYVYSVQKYSFTLIKNYPFTIIGGTIGTAVTSFLIYLKLKNLEAISKIAINIPEVQIELRSVFAPPSAILWFEKVKLSICEKLYLLGDLLGSTNAAVDSGFNTGYSSGSKKLLIKGAVEVAVPVLVEAVESKLKK